MKKYLMKTFLLKDLAGRKICRRTKSEIMIKYTCVYVYVIYTSIYCDICMCIYIDMCVCGCLYICIYIYVYIYVYMCVCIYIYVCVYVHMCICVYAYIYVCVYVHAYVYVYIYLCIFWITTWCIHLLVKQHESVKIELLSGIWFL